MKKGNIVYVVYDDKRRSPFHATIKSIGKKYIHIDNVHISESKFDIITHESVNDNTGWNCKAKLFESKESYETQIKENELKRQLYLKITNKLRSASLFDLERIYVILTNDKRKEDELL